MATESTHGLWGDLHRFDLSPEQTDFSILGIPYDGAVCARPGARLGPERIRHWSQHLTPFSEERTPAGRDAYCRFRGYSDCTTGTGFRVVRRKVATLPNIPILLGGDHSVTIPIFQGQRERFAGKRLGVLWVDAHPDLCDVFTGSKYSHACVLRRGLECGIKPEDVCLVGLRSWEDQEIDSIENGGLHVFTAADVAELGMKSIALDVRKVLSRCEAVHISLDIDCPEQARQIIADRYTVPDEVRQRNHRRARREQTDHQAERRWLRQAKQEGKLGMTEKITCPIWNLRYPSPVTNDSRRISG